MMGSVNRPQQCAFLTSIAGCVADNRQCTQRTTCIKASLQGITEIISKRELTLFRLI